MDADSEDECALLVSGWGLSWVAVESSQVVRPLPEVLCHSC